MEFTNQHSTETPEATLQKKGLKMILIGFAVLGIGALGYLGYTNPQLFSAAVTEVGVPTNVQTNTAVQLFIPDYTADAKDSGSIAIKTKAMLSGSENLVSVKFKLKYSPTDTLTFNANSLVFEPNKTLFQSADLKSVNTSTKGEVVVSLFSNQGAVVKANDPGEQTLFRLAADINGAAGSKIDLKIEDLEVIQKTAQGAYENSKLFTQMGAGTITLNQAGSKNELQLLNAESIDATHVLLRFSDLLAFGNPGTINDYYVAGGPTQQQWILKDVTIGSDPKNAKLCPTCDQSMVILEGTTKLDASGADYFVNIVGGAFINGNVQGGLSGAIDPATKRYADQVAGFFGYQPPGATISAVQIESIHVKSSTELTLQLSGAVDPKTVTPVNIVIISVGSSPSPLVITKAVANGSVIQLSTAQQIPEKKYHIAFLNNPQTNIGLKDASGKLLPNNRVPHFFGYKPSVIDISEIKPNSITNDKAQEIVVTGKNLDKVSAVRANTTNLTFKNQTAASLTLSIPQNFTTGIYDLIFDTQDKTSKNVSKGLIVSSTQQPFEIISGESKAVPSKINPDGKTKVILYALVQDPVDIANVDSVTIDLGPIGGARAQAMVKDTGLQKKGQQFYTFETTVNPNTPTSNTPYKLKVQARKGAQTVDGTVELLVTKDVLTSQPPTVDFVGLNPSVVSPDGKTPVKISAKISDPDGANTLNTVIADLTPLGLGFTPLKGLPTSNSSEQKTAFYESSEFKIPTTVKQGHYKISVSASDETGETAKLEASLEVSSSVSGPIIDKDKTYLGPRKSVPKDGKTTVSINAMVSDNDGVDDIDSVVAFPTSLGLKPITLTRDPKASTSAKSAFYSSPDFTIPPSAPVNVHNIEIIATDKSGGKGVLNLSLDVTYEDTVGDAPLVLSKKSYTTPKMAVNDGKTRLTLYAFVRDDDQDLDSVIVNLKGIGQVGPEVPAELGAGGTPPATGTNGCPTGSNVIVCMKPSFTEGRDGQWFILPDVTISTRTAASNQPYLVEVIATDKGRKTGRGEIPVVVRDSANFTEDKTAPEMIAAVPVSPGKIEVVFNESILASTVSSVGKEFTVTQKSDINKTLNVTGATMNVDGNIITLTTEKQTPGEDYVLTATGIQDVSGIGIVPGRGNSRSFEGFEESRKGPVAHLVAATDQETVEIEFQEALRPSSLKLGSSGSQRGGDFDIRIAEADDRSKVLPIKSVKLLEGGKALEVKTEAMKSGARYHLQLENIASSGGNTLDNAISKFFKAIKYREVQQAAISQGADLNGDGKVDFIDFTLFSAAYGKNFGANTPSSGNSENSQGLQPITPKPNATVPTTSTPNQ